MIGKIGLADGKKCNGNQSMVKKIERKKELVGIKGMVVMTSQAFTCAGWLYGVRRVCHPLERDV